MPRLMAGLMLLVVAGYAGLGAAAEPQVITPVKVQFTNPTALWANPADGNFNFLENHQIYSLSASADKGQKRLRSWSYVDQVYFPYRPDDPANTLPVVLWADDRSTGQDAGLHLDGLTRQQVAPGGPPAASRTMDQAEQYVRSIFYVQAGELPGSGMGFVSWPSRTAWFRDAASGQVAVHELRPAAGSLLPSLGQGSLILLPGRIAVQAASVFDEQENKFHKCLARIDLDTGQVTALVQPDESAPASALRAMFVTNQYGGVDRPDPQHILLLRQTRLTLFDNSLQQVAEIPLANPMMQSATDPDGAAYIAMIDPTDPAAPVYHIAKCSVAGGQIVLTAVRDLPLTNERPFLEWFQVDAAGRLLASMGHGVLVLYPDGRQYEVKTPKDIVPNFEPFRMLGDSGCFVSEGDLYTFKLPPVAASLSSSAPVAAP